MNRPPMPVLALLCPLSAFASGNAVEFDGDSDYVELGALDPGTDFTVEFWLEPNSISSGAPYSTFLEVVNTTSSQNSLFIGVVSGNWQIEINDNDGTEGGSCSASLTDSFCTTSSLPSAGTATHVALTFSATEANLYIDGVLTDTEPLSGSPTFGSGIEWVLGADTDGSGYTSDPYDGVMEELRVWSTERSASEISCTMDYALTGDESDLYALYHFDESSGESTTADELGGFDGTLGGDADFTASTLGLTASTGLDITCMDYDGDGYTIDDGDCDESDSAVNPGATEVWYDGIDGDCDGASDYDADGDGEDSSDYGGDDCDDTDASINTSATETYYDGIDSDC
ncbi:MAG: hypothetical protein ACI8RZ_006648, partial [Myxococcota bacterium]